ncbi:MAG: hypothetical protein CFE43_15905 [Burkholderiales bacterium PBB3]|nr:MAG: hypothetical protein CFE43_15905 [Burkholderiales bacterium PBB3]
MQPGPVVGANGQGALSLIDTPAAILANDTDMVFDWAEKNFPQFSPAGAVSQYILGYRYRVYSNRFYLAVNQGGTPHIYYFDDQSMTTLMDVGLLADFLERARQ